MYHRCNNVVVLTFITLFNYILGKISYTITSDVARFFVILNSYFFVFVTSSMQESANRERQFSFSLLVEQQ